MIRKTVILGLILVVVVLLALPLAFSFNLKKYQSRYVTRLSQNSWLHVENVKFSRGWFSSRSRLTLVPDALLCSRDCPTIQINNTIYHGPLPFGAFSNAGVAAQLALGVVSSKVKVKHGGGHALIKPPLPPLHVTTIIHLDGNQHAVLRMPSSRHRVVTEHGKYRLNLHALRGSASLNKSSQIQQARLNTSGFNLKDAVDNAVVAQAHHAKVRIRRNDRGPIHFTSSLERLSVHNAGGAAFNLEGLQIESQSRKRNGLVRGKLRLGFNKLSTAARTYGPARLRLRTARLNTRALHRLGTGLAKLTSSHMSAGLSLIGALTVYQKNAAALLRPGPEVDIRRATLGTSKGRVSASLDIKVPPSESGAAYGLFSFINQLRIKGRARIPKPLMRALMRRRLALKHAKPSRDQVTLAINNLVSRGVLQPAAHANAYKLALRLRHGQLTLNGQPSTMWKELRSLVDRFARKNPLLRMKELPKRHKNGSPKSLKY